MKSILDAPCVFCGYDGKGYWQPYTHDEKCPLREFKGHSDRQRELRKVIETWRDERGLYERDNKY